MENTNSPNTEPINENMVFGRARIRELPLVRTALNDGHMMNKNTVPASALKLIIIPVATTTAVFRSFSRWYRHSAEREVISQYRIGLRGTARDVQHWQVLPIIADRSETVRAVSELILGLSFSGPRRLRRYSKIHDTLKPK